LPNDPTPKRSPDTPLLHADLNDDRVVPEDLKLKLADQTLTIHFKDGVVSEFQLGFLRRNCPCATCRTERENQQHTLLPVLKMDPSSQDLRVTNAELVGRYAIQLFWSDGHSTGIFDFRLLRSFYEQPPA